MASIEAIAAGLGTSAYIWGGWAPDIYRQRFLREHSDIDCSIYVLKMNPRLMNPDWRPRDKDQADVEVLRAMLLQKQVDLGSLLLQVESV